MTTPHEPTNVPLGDQRYPDDRSDDTDISGGLPAPGLAVPGTPAAGVPMSGVPAVAVPPLTDDGDRLPDDADTGEHDSGQAANPRIPPSGDGPGGVARPDLSELGGSGGDDPGNDSGGVGAAASTAQQKASDVAGSAVDATKQVAGTAQEQASRVTHEAGRQLSDVLHQGRSEAMAQAQQQQSRAAGGLRSLGAQLASMADGADQGMARDATRQLADRAHQVAGWLEDRDPQGLLDDVRAYARRSPGMFLALSLGAGVLAGRLARGMADRSDGSATASSGSTAASASTAPSTDAVGERTGAELADALGAQDFRDPVQRHREGMPEVTS